MVIDFDYELAADVAGALRAGAAPSSRYVAGGTTLLDLMKLGVENPTRLVDVNALGASEIGMTGVAGAVANAVYHATGKRVRDLPITLDKLL